MCVKVQTSTFLGVAAFMFEYLIDFLFCNLNVECILSEKEYESRVQNALASLREVYENQVKVIFCFVFVGSKNGWWADPIRMPRQIEGYIIQLNEVIFI